MIYEEFWNINLVLLQMLAFTSRMFQKEQEGCAMIQKGQEESIMF
jgi:hypothetical protein